jgi:pyruvate dehydrogenase E2 component (dihydrolipoamide acetyltransferase)
MPVELRMPSLGMTMEEGRVVSWLVTEGQRVARGQILVEIESEKVAYEVESPADGIVGAILVSTDAVVPVGTPLVFILAPEESVEPSVPVRPERPGTEAPARPEKVVLARPAADTAESSGRRRLSPRARKLAESLGVDASALIGTGPEGSIVEEDIRKAASGAPQGRPAPAEAQADGIPFVLRPLTSMRRTIAERMTASAREAPHFYLAAEVDGTALLRYREAHGTRLETETGIKLTLTDLLLRATARALRAHRALNASYAPDGVREWDEINLGLAVAVEDGLVVPVIHRADGRTVGDLMAARADVAARARAGKLRPDDVAGGTFTLSNLGGFGIDFFTSILNSHQAGILSIGALRERPAVVDGRMVARPAMMIGLTIDHRVTDGAAGARFLGDLRARIERASLDE